MNESAIESLFDPTGSLHVASEEDERGEGAPTAGDVFSEALEATSVLKSPYIRKLRQDIRLELEKFDNRDHSDGNKVDKYTLGYALGYVKALRTLATRLDEDSQTAQEYLNGYR